jgi:hypothetical protein
MTQNDQRPLALVRNMHLNVVCFDEPVISCCHNYPIFAARRGKSIHSFSRLIKARDRWKTYQEKAKLWSKNAATGSDYGRMRDQIMVENGL